jgi:D-glycero-D-manno-heptose 1,7-bisphosphate phosphatase
MAAASNEYNLDKDRSWFIGDRDTDIQCGINAQIKTILVKNENSLAYIGKIVPDFIVNEFKEAISIIIEK